MSSAQLKLFSKYVFLFFVGGMIYCCIEILWRGYTHWTMLLLGGFCFVSCGMLNEIFTWELPLVSQMAISSIIVTFFEFIIGCYVNLYKGWNIWDYSNMHFNIMGQVCLEYMGLWFLLSAAAIIVDDYLRYIYFDEEKPRYKLF